MNKKNIGVQTTGIKLPIMRQGDDLINTVVDCVLEPFKKEKWYVNGLDLGTPDIAYEGINDKDVVGITESLLGRCYELYVAVDDIAIETIKFFGNNAEVWMTNAIYSRNRHSLILRGIARACKRINFVATPEDSRGNLWGVNPFTGVDIPSYYKQICEEEGCEFIVYNSKDLNNVEMPFEQKTIDCRLHTQKHHKDEKYPFYYYLTDYCNDKCPDFGLLGTNKANNENGGTLKLFPPKKLAEKVCNEVKKKIKEKTQKDVIVCIYADGCFHSPYQYDENGEIIPGTSINDFADPVTMPGYTDRELIESTPNELKLKYLIDSKSIVGIGEKTEDDAIAETIEVNHRCKGKGQMGTTPRLYRDLLASLMDLTSGSGDRATPVVLIQNYFN